WRKGPRGATCSRKRCATVRASRAACAACAKAEAWRSTSGTLASEPHPYVELIRPPAEIDLRREEVVRRQVPRCLLVLDFESGCCGIPREPDSAHRHRTRGRSRPDEASVDNALV